MEIEIESLPEQINNIPTKAPNEEGLLQTGAKTLGRSVLNVAQIGAGYVDDIGNLISDLVSYPVRKSGVISQEDYEREKSGKRLIGTSHELKEKTHELFPWTKTEPGSWEESLERTVELISSFSLPGAVSKFFSALSEGPQLASTASKIASAGESLLPGFRKAAFSPSTTQRVAHAGKEAVLEFGKGSKANIGKILGAETAGWLTKELTGDENKADTVRMGTLVLLQLRGFRNLVKNTASDTFNKSKELAQGAESVKSPGLKNSINRWKRYLTLGDPKSKENIWFQSKIDPIVEKLNTNNGNFEVNDAVKWVQDLREQLRNGEVPYRAQHHAYDLIDTLKKDIIDPYKKINPKFGEMFEAAEEAWSALHKENKFTNFIREKLVDKPWVSKIGNHLFSGALLGAAHHSGISKAVPFAGAALAGIEAYRFIDLLKKSSIARNTFYNLVKQAGLGNVSAASKLASKFDKEAAKYEESNSSPTEMTDMIELESIPTN